jgi:proteasome lid subunit RPN8/RPN11
VNHTPVASSTEVTVSRAVIDGILEHGRREAPGECCGLLVGSPLMIDEFVPTENVAVDRSRFHVNPAEHIALNRRLRGSGRDVVGVYHSHPNTPPIPSPRDIEGAHYPEFLHIIASLVRGSQTQVRAFRIRDGAVIEVSLRISADG